MEDDAPTETTLLADLDQRQDKVLDELERLNEQILKVIGDWTNTPISLGVV